MSEDNQFTPPPREGNESLEPASLGSTRPSVAAAPKEVLVFILLAIAFVGIVMYFLFSSPAPAPKPVKKEPEKVASSNTIVPASALPPPPNFAPITPVATTTPPPAPPPILPPAPQITSKGGPNNEKLHARMASPMMAGGATGGGAFGSSGQVKKKSSYAGNDPNNAFAQSVEESSADSVTATRVNNLNRTIIQGKLVQAVLETAIDSTLPGPIRAIVSHDTYAESGRSILIPKGSRIIGVYNSSVRRGQARVFIIWTRVIRPDGIDIAINSPAVDALGRTGMEGYVDDKYFEAFSTAILASMLDIGVAATGDALFGNQQQTTTTTGGGTTTTSSPTATAMQEAIQNVGDVGKSIVGSTLNVVPTIHIDQGTEINIFVNHDLVFPFGMGASSGFVP